VSPERAMPYITVRLVWAARQSQRLKPPF